MRIETERLVIRSIQFGDEKVFAKMAEDGSLKPVGFDRNCVEWIDEWIREAIELNQQDNPQKDYLAYTVCLKDDGTVIGAVGCSWFEEFEAVGATYFLGKEFRGQGYALESVKEYLAFFFSHYPIRKMICTIREDNPGSWKLIEKTEFILCEKKMWKDYTDQEECMYRFYEMIKP